MWAVIAGKGASGRKDPPNRGMVADIGVISTLLPYCGAMFIDNQCRSLLNDIPNKRKLPYETRIFSLNTGEEFLAYLDEIKNTASLEHTKLVEEVYGPDWTKPYKDIFSPEKNQAAKKQT